MACSKSKCKVIRIIAVIFLGVIISIISMAVFIYSGYLHAYAQGGKTCEAWFGIYIYKLTLAGDKYVGHSIQNNMGIVSTICVLAVFMMDRIIVLSRRKH